MSNYVSDKYRSDATETFCNLHAASLTSGLKRAQVFFSNRNPNHKIGGEDFKQRGAREQFPGVMVLSFSPEEIDEFFEVVEERDNGDVIYRAKKEIKKTPVLKNVYPIVVDNDGEKTIWGREKYIVPMNGEAKGEHDNNFLTRGLKCWIDPKNGAAQRAPWGTIYFELWDRECVNGAWSLGNLHGYFEPVEHTEETGIQYKRPDIYYHVLTIPDGNGVDYGENIFCVLAFDFDVLAKRLEEIAEEMGVFTLKPWTVHDTDDYNRADIHKRMWYIPLEKLAALKEQGALTVTMVGERPAYTRGSDEDRRFFQNRLRALIKLAGGKHIDPSSEYLEYVKKRQEEREEEKRTNRY